MVRKTIGVLGGMGPAATVELFARIVNNTSAKKDSEHISMIIVNDPSIPDRKEYILGNGISPIPKLKENIIKLINAGADVIVIPCMTAHSFISELQLTSSIPIINGIELIEKYFMSIKRDIRKVGLLATTGSIQSGVFQKYLTKDIVTLDPFNQSKLMQIIYGEEGIKAGNNNFKVIDEINSLINHLVNMEAQAIIVGCTELGIVMNENNTKITIVDPITLLA